MIIANQMAVFADEAFELLSEAELTVGFAWMGALAYGLQIYYDFSGYSDMAIGLGQILGFSFQENFNYPYISKSATEFWRRWHISLSSWFRDYGYIPLEEIDAMQVEGTLACWWSGFALVFGMGQIIHSGFGKLFILSFGL